MLSGTKTLVTFSAWNVLSARHLVEIKDDAPFRLFDLL
jgi:hypothetical protein